MPIRIGTENIGDVYVGTERIGEIYVGTELVYQRVMLQMFVPTASYTGGTFAAAGGTIPTGSYNTNIANPSASIGSNAATDGQSALAFVQLSATEVYDGMFDVLSPANDQVFDGTTFTQSYTEDGTSTARRQYTNTITQLRADTNARTETVTVNGTIPTGQNFENEGGATSATMSVPQSGDTGANPPARAIPADYGGGTLAAGSSVARNGPVSAIERNGTQSATGTGTLSITVAESATEVDEGDTITYSLSDISTTFTGTQNRTYSWEFAGGITDITTSSDASPVVTTTGDGAVVATCTLTFPGADGTNFSAMDSETTTVNASGCTSGINFSNLSNDWNTGAIGETITFDICAATGETWFVGNVPNFATSSVGIGNQAGTG